MLVINQISPIYVSVAVPERQVHDITTARREAAARKQDVPMRVDLPTGGDPETGGLTFVDQGVNPATGTVEMKATFKNEDHRLWPGQFVNATLTLSTIPDALVVPSQAVRTGQQGSYVFVVKPDQTAESRPVTLGPAVGSDQVVTKGLQQGETVVVTGQLRLAPGIKVQVQTPGVPIGAATS
jgi:multidrug efflux system membrane fusion protein